MSTNTLPGRGDTGKQNTGGPERGADRRRLTFRSPARGRQARAAWLLAGPFLALFAAFMLLPVVWSLLMSLTDTQSADLRTPLNVSFVGFDNYVRLFQDDQFFTALRNTAVFVLVALPLTLAAGLAAAVALDRGIRRFRAVFRVGFYLPVITSIVAVAVVWKTLLEPRAGLVNLVLGWFGIDGPAWLADTRFALPVMILMAVWRNLGTVMIIMLAGLQSVPQSLMEAAELDGAGPWQRFWRVTFPLLRPALLLTAVTTGIGYLQFFDEPFVMTDGGPLDSTLSATLYAYKQFGNGNYEMASAASYVIFVLIVALTVLQFRVLRDKD
ncbi:sugar ABC transporter permease [Streptomyces europaeiscabiei]|nr:sugar ABC transporter permease [Streptomyces europaeiscabiei]MDX3580970.1 sugar ABC transporter permease [Streptomyces europaeiscabiei]MDX3614055.1 sugar ABC transporter permease [Streptomyces europaeiscabiei]MDX3631080.1 sugar ABC transporter permease [Streptomyces europaeiscabiei]MDX3648906.1 sugar ABC transporter permease [Streptomyces europaeiscabiei]